MRGRKIRLIGAGVYVGAVGWLAIAGGITQDGHYYLAAFILTLPLGLGAIVGAYGGYALLKGVGSLIAFHNNSRWERIDLAQYRP